jgi:hypothetical protein
MAETCCEDQEVADRCAPQPVSEDPRRLPCPDCGETAMRVTAEPVRFYVRDPTRITRETYYFCKTRGCATVYFDRDANRFLRDELTTRIGVKEAQAPHLVCYCFGQTEEAIEADFRIHQKTRIRERIRAEIAAGTCECEFRNPAGRCCLGDVTQAVRRAESQFPSREEARATETQDAS